MRNRSLGIFAAALLELRNGFLALLDHLFDDREHLGVVEHDALVDFTLLDGCEKQANEPEAIFLA